MRSSATSCRKWCWGFRGGLRLSEQKNVGRARSLRERSNTPEQIAWKTLRKFRALGYPVRRQHPVEGYVVDFAITKARLVIEVDGGIHRMPDVMERDEKRQAHLEAVGWRVLRVSTEIAMSSDHLFALVQSYLDLEG